MPDRFEAVIIDEAQDLLREPYLDVIDALIEGELKEGTWRCFIDASQNILGGICPRRSAPPAGCGASRLAADRQLPQHAADRRPGGSPRRARR